MNGRNDPYQRLWDEAHRSGMRQGLFTGFFMGVCVASVLVAGACRWMEVSSTVLHWWGGS